MPKFNLNWLYMIIAMMLLGLYLTNESGTATKNISYDEFQQYVRAPAKEMDLEVLKMADCLIVNETEASFYAGVEVTDGDMVIILP